MEPALRFIVYVVAADRLDGFGGAGAPVVAVEIAVFAGFDFGL